MVFDSSYPCFRDFDSVIPTLFVRIKPYVMGFFNPSYVLGKVMINKPNLVLNRNMSCFNVVFRNRRILSASWCYISFMVFNSICHRKWTESGKCSKRGDKIKYGVSLQMFCIILYINVHPYKLPFNNRK